MSHNYIGLSASTSSSSPKPGGSEVGPRLTLRLGLPGSESPDHNGPADVAAAFTLGSASHKGQGRLQALAPAIASPLRRCLTTERIRLDHLCKFPTAAKPLRPRARCHG